MVALEGVRRAVVGGDSAVDGQALGFAAGLFVAAAGCAALREFTPVPMGVEALYLLVAAGVVVAAASAARGGGLVLCWLVVLGPVCGPLALYRWVAVREGVAPVALPLSFEGHGAPAFWLPAALALGTAAFAVGTVLRRIRD